MIRKKLNYLGLLCYFLILIGKIRFLFFFLKKKNIFFNKYNYFRKNIPLNLIKISGTDLTCSILILMPCFSVSSGLNYTAEIWSNSHKLNYIGFIWKYNNI